VNQQKKYDHSALSLSSEITASARTGRSSPPPVRIRLGSRTESVDGSVGAAAGEGSLGARRSCDFDEELRVEWSHFLLIHVNE
jgi:hypothetical protein